MLLQLAEVTKRYDKLTAVNQLDLSIEKGEIFGLLGPNGAGKSTTISMISTLIKPTSGKILYKGEDIVKQPKRIQPEMGIVPQEIALYTTLTGLDNLKFWGKAYGLKGAKLAKRIDQVAEVIGIGDRLKDRVDKYSGGMKRRLNIGVALLHEPELLIMDEPTVGIDPQSRNHILETVKRLNQEGMTIIYTSHYMEEVEALCDRIVIMDSGKVIAQGTQDELLANISDQRQYIVTVDKTSTALAAELEALNNVENLMTTDKKYEFTSRHSGVIKDVFNLAESHQVNISSVDIEQPNLETVFLNLTGKALRD